VLWVDCADREALYARINQRVTKMAEKGIVAEVRAHFSDREAVCLTRGIDSAIGAKEFHTALTAAAGESVAPSDESIANALEVLRAHTRRYARQQQTWIKSRFVKRFGGLLAPLFWRLESSVAETAAPELFSALLDYVWGAASVVTFARDGVTAVPAETVEEGAAGAALVTATCDLCGVTVCGEEQRQAHWSSRRHRGAAAKAERHRERAKRERESGGLERPPSPPNTPA